MAKKKTSGALAKRLERDLKKLGELEKTLARAQKNLRSFLDQDPVVSGPEYLDERLDKILKKKTRQR